MSIHISSSRDCSQRLSSNLIREVLRYTGLWWSLLVYTLFQASTGQIKLHLSWYLLIPIVAHLLLNDHKYNAAVSMPKTEERTRCYLQTSFDASKLMQLLRSLAVDILNVKQPPEIILAFPRRWHISAISITNLFTYLHCNSLPRILSNTKVIFIARTLRNTPLRLLFLSS